MNVLREAVAVIAGFTLVALWWTWPLARALTSAVPSDLGDPLSLAFKLSWVGDRIGHGFAGFWNAPIYFPYARTFAYSEHVFGIGLFTAPVYLLTGNPLLTYNAGFLFSVVLAACGMYLLVRSLTGRRDAAVLAALAFAFGPHRAGRLSHLQVLAMGWMPIGLWAMHRYFASPIDTGRSRRYLLLAAFGAAFLFQGLSNGYFLYYFCVPVILAVGYGLLRAGRTVGWRVAELAVAAVVMFLLLLPFALPYIQLSAEGRLARTDQELLNYSADLASYGQISGRTWVWRNVLTVAPPERELFPGAVMIVLALAGCALAMAGAKHERGLATDRRGLVLLYLSIALAGIVLSLGPKPEAWGQQISDTGPYGWLVAVVPGMDGLRVPARIAVIVFLGLAVLAGFGSAWLLAKLGRGARLAVAAVLGAAILIEGSIAPMQVAAFAPLGTEVERNAYNWLSRQPPGGVLELPVMASVATPTTFQYQFAALVHQHPIVNGYTGHRSSLQDFLGGAATPLYSADAIGEGLIALRQLGVRYVVLHRGLFERDELAVHVRDLLDARIDQVAERVQFGNVSAWRLAHHDPPPTIDTGRLPEIPRAAGRASSSVQGERLGMAFDGEIDTRWLSGTGQTGSELIEVQFNRAYDVARVQIDSTPRSFGDYPRLLLIESVAPSGEITELYRGPTLPLMMTGMAQDPYRAPLVFDVPTNETKTIRLRQLGKTRTWFWSIHELHFYSRQ